MTVRRRAAARGRRRSASHERRRAASVCFAICGAIALFGCDLDAEREQRVESARVLRAIQDLQSANADEKERARQALRETACTNAETCAARDACVRAYEFLDRSRRAARAAHGSLDALDANADVFVAAKATRDAETYAEQFKTGAARCLEARHRLETANIPK